MTPEEQDADIAIAQHLVNLQGPMPLVDVDRCRHKSVTETTLWFFVGGKKRIQVGVAVRVGTQWRASKMHKGSPYTNRVFDHLSQAIAHIIAS